MLLNHPGLHDGQGQLAPIFLPSFRSDCPIGRGTKKAAKAGGLRCSVAVAEAHTNSVAKHAPPEEKIIIMMTTLAAKT